MKDAREVFASGAYIQSLAEGPADWVLFWSITAHPMGPEVVAHFPWSKISRYEGCLTVRLSV
jgi:hypothetical protein